MSRRTSQARVQWSVVGVWLAALLTAVLFWAFIVGAIAALAGWIR